MEECSSPCHFQSLDAQSVYWHYLESEAFQTTVEGGTVFQPLQRQSPER